jgi:hypothetical protein
MEDVKFHQCVRLARFENDRTISFIPPDGEFELMSYRISTPVKPLIWVEAAVESHKGSRVEYMVKCKAQFKRRSTANNVEIFVPVPDDADTPKFRVSDRSNKACRFRLISPDSRWIGPTGINWQRPIRSRQICLCLEDKTIRRRSRILNASALRASKCQKRYAQT